MRLKLLAAAVFAVLSGVAANALPLVPGGVVNPTGTTVAADPEQAGVVLQDNLLAFSVVDPALPLAPVALGNVQDRVVRSDVTGNLIFSHRIRDVSSLFGTTGGVIRRLEYGGYANNGAFTSDVDFRLDGLGDEGSPGVTRSADGNVIGWALSLDVGSLIGSAREESRFLTVKSNATHYSNTGYIDIWATRGDGTGLFKTRLTGVAVPDIAPVPLPASALMLGAALVGLMRFARKTA